MTILAIDPSFKNLSYSLYVGNGNVYMNTLREPLGTNIGFDVVFQAVRALWLKLKFDIDTLIAEGKINHIDEVFSEYAPPTAQFSSGLYALDTYILSNLFDTYTSIQAVYGISSSYLSTVHGSNKYKKGESTQLAKYYINEVFPDKFNLVIPDSVSEKGRRQKGKLNNDKAESFLFLLRAIVKYNIDDMGFRITNEMSGFIHEGEKLLIERIGGQQ